MCQVSQTDTSLKPCEDANIQKAINAGRCPDQFPLCALEAGVRICVSDKCPDGKKLCGGRCIDKSVETKETQSGDQGVSCEIICPETCIHGCDEMGNCACPKTCTACEANGACKCPECENGCDVDGKCLCPDTCTTVCNEKGACQCLKSCTTFCDDTGVCQCPEDCATTCDSNGVCQCPDICTTSCNTKTGACQCPTACATSCNTLGECLCKETCETSCNTSTGKCQCSDQCPQCNPDGTCECPECESGCDLSGNCYCDYIECEGENEKCINGECKDICADVECKDETTYCKLGICIPNDTNHNHVHDKYEISNRKGEKCDAYYSCFDAEDEAARYYPDDERMNDPNICDSFLDYQCAVKCKSNAQCVPHPPTEAEPYRYICRKDGRCAPDTFITVWDIPEEDKTLWIYADSCSIEIDWGDGAKEKPTSCQANGKNTPHHTYASSGNYTVKITGNIDGWRAGLESDTEHTNARKLRKVKVFGPVGLGPYSFAYTKAVELSDIDIPDASKMKDLTGLFMNSEFNQPLDKWDVSYTTIAQNMFAGNKVFNNRVNAWDTSIFENTSGMFKDCIAFNQPLDHWDTGSVEDMSVMFSGATKFNRDISTWNTEYVLNMSGMFQNCKSFDKPLGKWDTGYVTNMSGMFLGAEKFNQPLPEWDVTEVLSMERMFKDAKSFNQPLSNWEPNQVTNMNEMFSNAEKFNHDVDWQTLSLRSMTKMFHNAKNFNSAPPLDIGKSTSLEGVFMDASSFDQELTWNTSKVTNMKDLFNGAIAFDQDISTFNVEQVKTYTNMLKGTNLSIENYCAIIDVIKTAEESETNTMWSLIIKTFTTDYSAKSCE